jgi:hypothetical protein
VVYDHVVTLPDEWYYIWSAPPSFHKYAFLVNRYSVPLCLLLAFMPISGFIGLTFSDLVRVPSTSAQRFDQMCLDRHAASFSPP